MSGIAGIYQLDGRPVAPDLLERMTQAVSHRGPDGAGLWRDGTIGLGHRLLHSTPESAWESSPSTSPEGSLVITADARLDNRQELIAELSLDGKSRSEIPDPEIILEAYEKWGEDCPNRLIATSLSPSGTGAGSGSSAPATLWESSRSITTGTAGSSCWPPRSGRY